MVSEHLTINGFDSRVYLGAARAQAAAMRANGQKNQSRHTVLGGTTIDVQIQGSHTYIKIDAGGEYARFFFTFMKNGATHVYMCNSLRSAPVELANNLPPGALPTKATYVDGSVVLTPTYSSGCISIRLADKVVSVVEFPVANGMYFQSSVAYATEDGKLGVLAVYRNDDSSQPGVAKVYEGSPMVEVATYDLPVSVTYSHVVLAQTDTHYQTATVWTGYTAYECVSLGPGYLLVLGQSVEIHDTLEDIIIPPPDGIGDSLDGSTSTVTSDASASFSAFYSTDYGRNWAPMTTLPGGVTPPVDTVNYSTSYEKVDGVLVLTSSTVDTSGGAGVPSAKGTTTSKKDKGHVGWGDIYFTPGSSGLMFGYSMQPPETVVAVSASYADERYTNRLTTYLGSSTWVNGHGSFGLYRTLDNGANWSVQLPITDSIIMTGAFSLGAVLEGGKRVSNAWALCVRPGTLVISLYTSQDGGASWPQAWGMDATAEATSVVGPSEFMAAIIQN